MKFDSDYKMLIDGRLVGGKASIDVYNPATGKVVANVPNCTASQLDDAIEAAQSAFPSWRDTAIEERADILKKMGAAVTAHADELSRLFTQEQGRPIDMARSEIGSFDAWFQATSNLRPPLKVAEDTEQQYVETRYVPLGVVCAIVPWNFPVTLLATKVAPALLAGNTVVLKPSPFTPLCTLKMGELFKDILPPGVLNFISGGDQLGSQMTSHPGFDKISFTGSTAVGKKVMESAARDLKKITLELGGNDAAIVLPDVDVSAIAQSIFFGAFFNTAQVCVATKRLYVHEDVYDDLKDALHEIAKGAVIGDGGEQGVTLGPIQNKQQYDRVMNLMEDAKSNDLTLLQGSDIPEGEGYFVPVTIVDNPPEDSRVVQEEAFGPILPMLKFKDVNEVIKRANDSPYGLAGAVWSKDIDKAVEIARKIETGTVWVNQNLALRPDTPFGGRKQSGMGVEYGLEGLLEFMAPQSIYVAKST